MTEQPPAIEYNSGRAQLSMITVISHFVAFDADGF
jgi:hypothetical protein